MIVRKTRPEEYRRVNELFAICFEAPYDNCPIDPEHDDAIHWAAYADAGNMMSTFTVPTYDVWFDGNICKMGGIGGVATLPQYRRRGGIRACFEAALPDMYENGYDFSYLYPFSTAYYRKFGYECCVRKLEWAVDLTLLTLPKDTGFFALAEKDSLMASHVQQVDRIWEQRFNMMVQHQSEDYNWVAESDPAVKQEFTYVWFNAENTPKAYTTFRLANEADGRNLVCSRFCFADREGFSGLMQIFKSLAADHTYAKFQTPLLPGLQYLLPEWSLGAVKWNLRNDAGMVRVINAERVLKKARYIGSGQVVLEITDPQIPQNNGRFAVSFADGAAVSVERTELTADAVLDISAFSALIAGVCSFEEARYAFRNLEVRRENPCLRQMFYPKPMYITDYF